MTHFPPRLVSLDEFPESESAASGMRDLDVSAEPPLGEVELNVVYAHRNGRDLRLQIISPPRERDDRTTFPAIAYVQGSAWREQRLGQSLPALAEFAARGFVVAIVEYRPSSVAPFPAQVLDAKAAIEFLRENADLFHIDSEQMGVWGDSSGGHTALMVHMTQGSGELAHDGVEERPLRFAVDYFGPTDIAVMQEQPSIQDHLGADSPEGELIGGVRVDEHPELVAPTVVMNRIPRDRELPPLLMMHGSKDRLVPFDQSVRLFEAMRQNGQHAEFYRLPGHDHGGGGFWRPETLDIVEEFIRRALDGA